MKRLLFVLLVFSSLSSCSQKTSVSDNYPENVGDISVDANLDDPNFKVCDENRIHQYYNFGKALQYKGEKVKIIEHFKVFKRSNSDNDTGLVTIRFVVNCNGETGRFRVQGMSNDYTEKSFSKE